MGSIGKKERPKNICFLMDSVSLYVNQISNHHSRSQLHNCSFVFESVYPFSFAKTTLNHRLFSFFEKLQIAAQHCPKNANQHSSRVLIVLSSVSAHFVH